MALRLAAGVFYDSGHYSFLHLVRSSILERGWMLAGGGLLRDPGGGARQPTPQKPVWPEASLGLFLCPSPCSSELGRGLGHKKSPRYAQAFVVLVVGMRGFEPPLSRPPDVRFNRTKLHPDTQQAL